MRLVHRTAVLLAVASLSLAACSGDGVTGNTNQPNDLNSALAQFSQPSLSGAFAASGAPAFASTAGVPTGCAYNSGSKSFVCSTTTTAGITIARSYMLYDASGAPQSAFDPASTAAIRLLSSVKGTTSLNPGSLTIDETDDMTLSGLLSSTRVMNGTSKSQVTIVSGSGTPQAVGLSSTMTVANLTLPATAAAGSYPTSGTITSDVATDVAPGNTHVIMTMTFNGTSKVAVSISLEGHVQNCTMDLANPESMTCS